MQPINNNAGEDSLRPLLLIGKVPDFASASVSDALAALGVNPEAGLTKADVDARRKQFGYNEVAEAREHPLVAFLAKFWGLSAWMLELIMVLSAVLRKFSDLAVVSALLIVNAIYAFNKADFVCCTM